MVTLVSQCLGADELADLARGDLPDAEIIAGFRHLAGCSECAARFDARPSRQQYPLIPKYHILKELGRGGQFGVVYKALWFHDEPRIVALKLLRPADDKERNRFVREIEVQRTLDVPNVVKCLDYGEGYATLYYAMELIHGVPLNEYFDNAALGMDEKLAVFQRVCETVAAAHAKGVAHRDLKPSNILVDRDGVPHLLDFGLCSVRSEDWSSWIKNTQTKWGDVMGTHKYISPEAAWGGCLGPIDQRSDIWALGVMLYEIATEGGYPYALGPSADRPAGDALLHRIRHERPLPPHIRSGEYTPGLKRLIDACLVHEPYERITAVGTLAEDIRRMRANRPVRTRPLRWSYRLRRIAIGWAIKSRTALWAGIVAAVLVFLNVFTSVFGVSWRVRGLDYDLNTRRSAALASTPAVEDRIAILGISEETVAAVVDFARRDGGLGEVTSDLRTWRPVHARLVQRLARVGLAALVWDVFFSSPQPGDERLVEAIRTLDQTGVPVVLAFEAINDDGTPQISPHIYRSLERVAHFGGIHAVDLELQPGELIVAMRRGERNYGSLSLATVGALLHPNCNTEVEWSAPAKQFQMKYERRSHAGAYLGVLDRIGVSLVTALPDAEKGLQAGDVIARKKFELNRPELWRRRTVPYEQALTGSDDDLRRRLGHKIVIVGALFRDVHSVMYDGAVVPGVPGCFVQADAVRGLLENDYHERAAAPLLAPLTLALLMLVASLSCALAVPLAGSRALRVARPQRVAVTLALVGSAVGCAQLIARDDWWHVHLLLGGVTIGLALPAALLVEFARNRFRAEAPPTTGASALVRAAPPAVATA